MVGVHAQAKLLEVVLAFHAGSGFAHFLHRWEQQANQYGYDGDNN